MKKIFSIIALGLCLATPLMAQYEELPERKVANNQPLSTFASQRDQLFNFGWRFQYGPADKDAVIREEFDDSQ